MKRQRNMKRKKKVYKVNNHYNKNKIFIYNYLCIFLIINKVLDILSYYYKNISLTN
jgi:hypothetical protein